MSPNPSDVTVQKRDATQYLSRNQLKFQSDKYELKHLGAVTADADMLVQSVFHNLIPNETGFLKLIVELK